MKKETCSGCSGKGSLRGTRCPLCNGKGRVFMARVPRITQRERSLKRRGETRKKRYDQED